jgi:drug/metabolite transporter (DMT)-like permease
MCLAVAAFVAHDAAMKHLAGGVPMVQALALRNAGVTMLFAALAAATGALRQWRVLTEPLVWYRSAADTTATLLYMLALPHVALTLAVTLNMATPIVMLPMAVLVLGERINRSRGLAVAVGFSGVLIVLRPAEAPVNAWLLASAASALFFSARDVITRRVPVRVPTLLLALVMTAVLAGVCSVWTALAGWVPLAPRQWLVLAASATLITAGYYLCTVALRMGEVSLTSAFRYTAVPWGAAWGYFLWGEVPDTAAVVGAGLVLGAGLYALLAERPRRTAIAPGV